MKKYGEKDYGIADMMIEQERNIQLKIQKQIADTPNEIELYYYVFYLINSSSQTLIVNKYILDEYSNKSLKFFVITALNDVENNEILSKRTERYKDYEIMWNQIEYEESEKLNRMAMFFGFASEYIYGKKTHMMTLTILHPELLKILSNGIMSYMNGVTDAVKKPSTSLFEKVKSFFK